MLPVTLNTPTSIYDAVKIHFIYASLNVTSTNPVELDIKLAPNLPIVHLTSAVNKEIFEYALYSYSLSMKISDMASNTKPRPYLDPTLFSVAEPLTDWKKFRRVICAAEGKDCLDVIIEFLLDPSTEKLLKVSNLGFDPESSTQYLSDKDIEYFEDISKKISGMNLEKRKQIVNQIQLKYPSVFGQYEKKLEPLTKEITPLTQPTENWFTIPAYIAVATLVNNVSYAIFPTPFLLGLNVLLRFSGIVTAVYHKKHVAGLSGLINLVAMLNLRNGWMMTPIDLLSVGVLCYRYRILNFTDSHKPIILGKKKSYSPLDKAVQAKRVNIKDLNQAYLCMSIPENRKYDHAFINDRYTALRNHELSRQSKLPEILADQIQFIIEDLDGAYKTICSHLPPPNLDLPSQKEPWWKEASLSID